MFASVRKEVMSIIDFFVEEAPSGKSSLKKMVCLLFVFFLKISMIKVCHMVSKEHPEVIEGRQLLIAVDILELSLGS